MYTWSYILHIVGVVIWIGSFLVLGYLLKGLTKRENHLKNYAFIINRIQKWVMIGVLPSLVLILLSGTYMILQLNRDTLPLYLTIMEQGGTLIILLTIIFVSIYSVKLTKRLQGIPVKKEKSLTQLTKIYTNYLVVSALLGIGIIIIVGLRLV